MRPSKGILHFTIYQISKSTRREEGDQQRTTELCNKLPLFYCFSFGSPRSSETKRSLTLWTLWQNFRGNGLGEGCSLYIGYSISKRRMTQLSLPAEECEMGSLSFLTSVTAIGLFPPSLFTAAN